MRKSNKPRKQGKKIRCIAFQATRPKKFELNAVARTEEMLEKKGILFDKGWSSSGHITYREWIVEDLTEEELDVALEAARKLGLPLEIE